MTDKKHTPATSFDLIQKWFKKCEFSARMIGKDESAALWKDGLEHLERFSSLNDELLDALEEMLAAYSDDAGDSIHHPKFLAIHGAALAMLKAGRFS